MLILDNDFTTKCVAGNVLDDVLAALGKGTADCLILSALKHQLRTPKCKLYRGVGATVAERALAAVADIASLPDGPAQWLDLMRDVEGIDPGDAELFAATASNNAYLLATADKRAIRAAPNVPGLCTALSGKIIILEQALLLVYRTKGIAYLRQVGAILGPIDKSAEVCFASREDDTVIANLERAIHDLAGTTDRSILWTP